MRKLISLMHASLDGFCAGPQGEMDWIGYDDTIFADATTLIHQAGAAVYGRVVHDMMRGYWPTLLDKPDSAQVQHAHWVEQIPKLTFSRTMPGSDWNNVQIRRDARDILQDKQQPGKDLLIFGSPRLVHAFLALDAIDECPQQIVASPRSGDLAVHRVLQLRAGPLDDQGDTGP